MKDEHDVEGQFWNAGHIQPVGEPITGRPQWVRPLGHLEREQSEADHGRRERPHHRLGPFQR